jgi:hypothetical protein
MRKSNEFNECYSKKSENRLNFEQLFAQLRQDQLEAALAGRIAESAFYAAEARALCEEYRQENALCA